MRLNARVERLERQTVQGMTACTTCRGEGGWMLIIEQPPLESLRLGACRECGREGAGRKTIRLDGSNGPVFP